MNDERDASESWCLADERCAAENGELRKQASRVRTNLIDLLDDIARHPNSPGFATVWAEGALESVEDFGYGVTAEDLTFDIKMCVHDLLDGVAE